MDLSDAVRILGYLFLGAGALPCLDAGDVDNDGKIDVTDAIRVLGYLFLGAAAPPNPGPAPAACGIDPGTEHLGCQTYTSC